MSTKNIITGIIISLLLGFGAGYFSKPTKIETRTVEVVKKQESTQQDTNKIVYKEKIVYKDGTVKEIVKTEDKTSSKETSFLESSKSSMNIVKNDLGLNLSVLGIKNLSNSSNIDYGVHVTKRVISNVTVGAFATSDKSVGLSIGVSF